MPEITLWKDKGKKTVDPFLFSTQAEALAKDLAADSERSRNKANKRTQLRRFYDEVLRLDSEAKTRPEQWDNILPRLHMLTAKAAYARGRELVSENFVNFIRNSINQISHQDDLVVFANFFEALMGFYRLHRPAN
ncbi:type III-A CRISPR-associated protein Csm2 [Desulfobacca acetoxidans]